MFIRRRFAGVALSLLTATGALISGAAPAEATHNDLRARLEGSSSYPAARGLADYAGRHGHDHRALDVKVRHVRRLAGETLVVYVHGVFAGRMEVSSRGRAHLHRHHLLAIQDGWRVRIRIARAETLVATGTLTHHAG